MAETEQQRPLYKEEFERLLKAQHLGLEKERAYLERWKTDVGPVEQQGIVAHQSAIIFAHTAIKSGYLLNGGGLLALPAFVGLFKISLGNAVIASAIFFFIGLCLAAAANISAFHTMDEEGNRLHARREKLATELNAKHNPDGNPPDVTSKKIREAEAKADTAGARMGVHRDRGLRCLYGAGGFFVAGCLSLLVAIGKT